MQSAEWLMINVWVQTDDLTVLSEGLIVRRNGSVCDMNVSNLHPR
jgi:hypothetical protein